MRRTTTDDLNTLLANAQTVRDYISDEGAQYPATAVDAAAGAGHKDSAAEFTFHSVVPLAVSLIGLSVAVLGFVTELLKRRGEARPGPQTTEAA